MDAPSIWLFPGFVVLVFLIAAGHFLLSSKPPLSAEAPAPEGREAEPPDTDPSAGVSALQPFVRSLGAAIFWGTALGFVVGGIGSRAAMRLLFLTTGDEVRGLESDDGFTIGQFGLGETLGLVLLGTIVGLLGGAAYLLIRRWLPAQPLRGALCAAGGGVVVGSMIVHDEGVDFHALKPLWLAVGLFVLIPALFGALVSVLVDRSDRPESWFHRKPLAWAAAPLALLAFPPLFFFVAIPAGLALLARSRAARSDRLLALWESTQFLWAGRIVIGVIGLLGTLALANDLRALL